MQIARVCGRAGVRVCKYCRCTGSAGVGSTDILDDDATPFAFTCVAGYAVLCCTTPPTAQARSWSRRAKPLCRRPKRWDPQHCGCQLEITWKKKTFSHENPWLEDTDVVSIHQRLSAVARWLSLFVALFLLEEGTKATHQ